MPAEVGLQCLPQLGNLIHRVSWFECRNSYETLSSSPLATFCPVLRKTTPSDESPHSEDDLAVEYVFDYGKAKPNRFAAQERKTIVGLVRALKGNCCSIGALPLQDSAYFTPCPS